MTEVIVRIDPNSIRKNPDGGHTISYFIPGQVHETDNGFRRDTQRVKTLHPEPSYFFKYKPCYVDCEHCGNKFLKEEIIEEVSDVFDAYSNEWYEEYYLKCPRCKEELNVTFVFEELDGKGEIRSKS